MHNLSTVIRFEVLRTLKKKSFWIAALAIPVVTALVGVVIFFSSKTSGDISKQLSNERYSLAVTDDSKLVSPQLLQSIDAKTFPSKEEGIEAVKSGQLEAFFYYPQNITDQQVEVYGKEVGLFKRGRYEALASQLLFQSALITIPPGTQTILQEKVGYAVKTYTNGEVDKGILKVIAPGIFLLLLYFMITVFGSQMLTSVTEEKENRVIEMILTTIKPTTLLLGKLFSLIILAFIQTIVVLVPIIAGYFAFRSQLSLPNFDLSSIPFNPMAITLGAIIFVVSFLMYTGILMTLGAAMPTAKEANSFFGAVIAFTFGPLYAASLFVSAPESPLVQVLSYFPLTSPIPLLLRNAVGNLQLHEALIAISLLLLTTVIAIRIGVRIFRFGALEYSRKLSLGEVLRRKS